MAGQGVLMTRYVVVAVLCSGCLAAEPVIQMDAGEDTGSPVSDMTTDAATDGSPLEDGSPPPSDPITITDADVSNFPNFYYLEIDIERLGCAACHQSQAPVLENGQVSANYTAFSVYAKMGSNSPVLTANLTGAATAHPVRPFTSTTDNTYQRWLAWINAGAMK